MYRGLPWRLLITAAVCLAALGNVGAAEGVGEGESVGAVSPVETEGAGAAAGAASGPAAEVEEAPGPTEPTAPPEVEVVEEEEGAGAEEGVPPLIASIEVVGNKEITTEEILEAVTGKVGRRFSEDQVAHDREAVRSLGWFQTVAVEREIVESGIQLVFRVAENPLITDVEFDGIRELTREELLAVMETKPGQVYNAALLRRDNDAMEGLYDSKGYNLAMMGTPRMSREGVLTLTIAEGVIQAIEIRGNTRTKTHVIRRYIRTNEGETYNVRKLARDVTRLMKLGYFETVHRDAEVGDEWGKVRVIITVVERALTGNVGFGVLYGSVQGMIVYLDLRKTNLGGTGQSASLRGEFGGRKSYQLGYQHPWIMTPETRLNLGLYNSFIVREAFITTEEGYRRSILYDERRTGGNMTLGRPVSDHTTVYLRLRSDDVSIAGLTEEEEPYLGGAAFQPREVRSVTLAASTDTRQGIYDPRRGAYSQFSLEFAGVFGGVNFNKYTMDNRRYAPLGSRSTLAVRLLAGITTGEAPYLEQFLIGGTESLRGYREDRFAGSRMAILNLEYRQKLTDNLLGVLFVDVGDAWGGAIAADPYFQGDETFTAHVGYGAGIRVRTPIGPLRLDLGLSEEGTETHFGVRHMF